MQSRERESIDIDLSRYFLIIKLHWIGSVSIFVVTVSLAIIAAVNLEPSYQATGKLLFKSSSFNIYGNNLLPNQNDGSEASDLKPLVANQNPISTQIEVISSRPLLRRAIDELKLKNNKGKALEVKELENALKMKIVGGADVLEVSYTSHIPEESAAVVNKIMNLYLENVIVTNRLEAQTTSVLMIKALANTQASVKETEIELRKFKQNNNIIDLSEEARSAVTIINNLDTQINNIKSELDQATAQSNELRQKVGLTGQQAIAVSAISQSPAVQGVIAQLQDTDRQLANELSRFSDENPIVTRLKAKQASLMILLQEQIRQTTKGQTDVPLGQLQIGGLKQELIQNFLQVELLRNGLSQKLVSLSKSRSGYEQRAKKIPQLIQIQSELERKSDVAKSTYQTLLKKVQELQLAENKNTANARIITPALAPQQPLSTEKMMILVLGILAGTLFSTSYILVMFVRDKSLKAVNEIRKIFDYKLLGIIPLLPKETLTRQQNSLSDIPEIVARDKPKSLESEMYYLLQANLKFLCEGRTIKTIVITSTLPNEGKSMVAANLAVALAQLRHNVLIIDADMRIPTQHRIWNINRDLGGLSDVLVKQKRLRTSISEVMDNLDILNAGSRPSNPLSLLDSKRMESLIKACSSIYDFIIIDTPPILTDADALVINNMSDGILFVARPFVIDARSALLAKERLEVSGQNVLGMVINGAIEKHDNINYYCRHNKDLEDPYALIEDKDTYSIGTSDLSDLFSPSYLRGKK